MPCSLCCRMQLCRKMRVRKCDERIEETKMRLDSTLHKPAACGKWTSKTSRKSVSSTTARVASRPEAKKKRQNTMPGKYAAYRTLELAISFRSSRSGPQ